MQLNGSHYLYRQAGGLGRDKKGSSGGRSFQQGSQRNSADQQGGKPPSGWFGATSSHPDVSFSPFGFGHEYGGELALPQHHSVVLQTSLPVAVGPLLDIEQYLETAYENRHPVSPGLPAPQATAMDKGLVYQPDTQQAHFVFKKGDTPEIAAHTILNAYPGSQEIPLPLMQRAVNHTLNETRPTVVQPKHAPADDKPITPGTQLSVNDTLVWVGLLYKTLHFNPELARQVSPNPDESISHLSGQFNYPKRVEVLADGTAVWSGVSAPLPFQTFGNAADASLTGAGSLILYTLQWIAVLILTGFIALGLAVFIDPNQIQELDKGLQALNPQKIAQLWTPGPTYSQAPIRLDTTRTVGNLLKAPALSIVQRYHPSPYMGLAVHPLGTFARLSAPMAAPKSPSKVARHPATPKRTGGHRRTAPKRDQEHVVSLLSRRVSAKGSALKQAKPKGVTRLRIEIVDIP